MGTKEDLELVRSRIPLTRRVAAPDQGDGIDRVETAVDPHGVAAHEALDRIAVALGSRARLAEFHNWLVVFAGQHLPMPAKIELNERIRTSLIEP